MDTRYELSFRPCDALENAEFESALHAFVDREAKKDIDTSSSVFARYDTPHARWLLSFETQKALQAFRSFWRAQTERVDSEGESSAVAAAN